MFIQKFYLYLNGGKYQLLTERNIPVWIMEPVRGGKLASLDAASEAKLKALRPEVSVASWGFRFLQALPNVKMILSGMSNLEQMVDNIKTFSDYAPLTTEETELLLEIADSLKNNVPCTGCRYCCDGCPKGLDIPRLLNILNDLKVAPVLNAAVRLLSEETETRYAEHTIYAVLNELRLVAAVFVNKEQHFLKLVQLLCGTSAHNHSA